MHTREFVSQDGVCTNLIEGLWGTIKQRINSMHGVHRSHIQLYLDEFSYKHQFKGGNIFYELGQVIQHHDCNLTEDIEQQL